LAIFDFQLLKSRIILERWLTDGDMFYFSRDLRQLFDFFKPLDISRSETSRRHVGGEHLLLPSNLALTTTFASPRAELWMREIVHTYFIILVEPIKDLATELAKLPA